MFSTLGHDSITLHYQPLAQCRGTIVGMEALMRWHHRERGPISPEAFIPIFERSGLIVPLSRWALGEACREAASWANPLTVAVNLSAIQFDEDDLPALVETVLENSGLAPGRLDLEVSEEALVASPRSAAATLARLRDLGVRVALADFGAGDTGPSYVKEFPFSKIKVAQQLVTAIEDSASARSIIHMVIELGHALGLSVAAHGVETPGQLAFLTREGCDWVQGYLIGRPGPIEGHAAHTGSGAVALRVGATAPAHQSTGASRSGFPAEWPERLAS